MAPSATTGNRPRPLTILAAAFLAGGAAAVGLNHFLDVHLSQRKPVVESEPIFIAMRSLPSGSPVTVWDVALRNWPKAMLPTTAMRVEDSFDGMRLKMPLREGQPLLSVQLEPLMAGGTASTVADAGSGDGSMIVVDDRTKVQVNWPTKPARKPAATDAARTSVTPPTADRTSVAPPAADRTAVRPADDRFAIRPMTPPKPARVSPATKTADVDEAANATEAAAVQQPEAPVQVAVTQPAPVVESAPQQPVEPVEPVMPVTTGTAEVAEVASSQPEPAPIAVSEQLPEVRIPSDTPSLATIEAAPVVPAPAAPLMSILQQQPATVAATPKPVVPQTGPVVTSQRHLVVPERIAVMADEATAGVQPQQVAPEQPGSLDIMQKLSTPPTTSNRPMTNESAAASAGVPRVSSASMRPNPLRSQSSQPVQARPQTVAPITTGRPQPRSTQPQAVQPVPRVAFPQASVAPSQSSPSNSQAAANEANESRLFPRVSARFEKAGEDWSRFRQSIFGSTEE